MSLVLVGISLFSLALLVVIAFASSHPPRKARAFLQHSGSERAVHPFNSKDHIREYVESELAREVIPRWPALTLAHCGGSLLHLYTPAHSLWWVLESDQMDPTQHLLIRQYLIEARTDEREFLIWFGELTGFVPGSPRDVMRPAVHVPFSVAEPARESYALGAVVRFMLEHEYKSAEAWSPVVFPMNGQRY